MSARSLRRVLDVGETHQPQVTEAGDARPRTSLHWLSITRYWAASALLAAIGIWCMVFTNLALTRHHALGTHAEDLGFTDQVIWNMVHGRWFEMTVYQGASWNTELDISKVRSPNSLNAFHVEPMLVLFTPLYALGGLPEHLLVIQSVIFALGAIPASRLATRLTGSSLAGLAVGSAWLLSPLGQWAVLSDFHTIVLAAPLLVFAAERFVAGQTVVAVCAALVAASAREDAAIAAAGLGFIATVSGRWRSGGLLVGLGIVCAGTDLAIMRLHSGGAASPMIVRYASLLGGPSSASDALRQAPVTEYLQTIMLSGGWLGVLAPFSLAPALPLLAINVFSSSPWMSAGRAHYSALILPFLVIGAAGGLGLLTRLTSNNARASLRLLPGVAAVGLMATSTFAYKESGAGPLAANYSPAEVTSHGVMARAIAASIPADARVTATASLYPHVSQRSSIYVFPAIEDADYALIDVVPNPAPTSAGDVYLRISTMLESGEWSVETAHDGVILLRRTAQGAPACTAARCIPEELFSFVREVTRAENPALESYLGGALELVSGQLIPTPDGAVEPDGPRGRLRTTWRAHGPLPDWVSPTVRVQLSDGTTLATGDLAGLWWYPPKRWQAGETVTIDVPGVPLHQFVSWSASIDQPEPRRIALGELSLEVSADPWRMRLLSPSGSALWEEALGEPIGFQAADGAWRRAQHLNGVEQLPDGGTRLSAATDDPTGRTINVDLHRVSSRSARISVSPSDPTGLQRVGGSMVAPTDERFVGFGERFTGVNQRGKLVDVWADDRILAKHGESTYAPIPLLLSSRGHSLLLERSERAQFDLAATRPDRWSWEQQSSQADLVVSYGGNISELVQQHVAFTGLPPRPPIWAFGVIKTSTGGQDHVLDEMQRLREMRIPVSAVYAYDSVDYLANIGWPYVNYAGRAAGPYPDHAVFTAKLHQLGLKALTYFKADFHLDRPGWEVPAERGFLVKGPSGDPLQHQRFPVTWLDFTNLGAVDWWRSLWQRALGDLGYDGGMLDVGEILPANAVMADGSSGEQAHNRYPLLYAQYAWQHASAIRPNGDFLLFARSGAAGAQKYQSLQWPGDPTMQWEAPAGLRSLIPAALSFGLSGFPYWHPEVGGYVQVGLSREQERELWMRWLQLGTWSSTLRDQYGDYPLAPMDLWLDETNQTAFRDAARIHNSLVPYIYSSVTESASNGLPLMRYLPLETPDDPRAWDEEQSYYFGRDILVAPSMEPGATTRTLYLPRGSWSDFWTDEIYEGGQEITVPAPLEGGRAPAFIRAGAIIPLAPEVDTFAPAATRGVRSYEQDLIVRIAPGGSGGSSFILYDGTSLAWDDASLRVSGNPVARSVTLRVPGKAEVTERVEGSSAEIGS